MDTEAVTYKNIDPKVRKIAILGMALGMLLACLDGTVVGTCATVIASDLQGMDLYAWLVTAFLLCETAMMPVAGKMSDHFGRKPLFLLGIVLFTAGSVIAGLSTSMVMLIACRAVQGLGAGMIVPVAMASVGDFYAPHERGKVQGAFGAIFGIGSGIGPLVGGFVCNVASWHWIFYINVPLAVVCILMTMKKFPSPVMSDVKKIDYAGIAVLTAVILDVILFFQFIQNDIQIVSIESLIMIIIALAAFALFVFIEKRAEDPVIAPKLIHNNTIVKSMLVLFIYGIGMMGTLTYISMFLITIYGMDTMECGFALMPLVFGMAITSMMSGSRVDKTGCRVWIAAGAATVMVSMLLMSTVGSGTELWIFLVYTFFFGFGLGCISSVTMVAVQNSAEMSEMGMTTSSVSLVRSIGSTVGTAAYALMIGSSMDSDFASTAYGYLAELTGKHGTGLLEFLYYPSSEFPGLADIVKDVFAGGMGLAFLMAGLLFIITIIIGLRMRDGTYRGQ